ncbi:peptide/nickel transport system substrate-binding protein/oligopeptide transport system substrate-binding protein [Chryseomicrobium aureum]|uniref:ABC transporter substrate-binding protein n=1 Tax=Chryseomicrobium aureum TaxID=1441723 RepID=UPI00195DAD09|nr:ABC transporter substrate-binding protein [Chryseomicrobium aureum]MBM7707422.1 peptide/nickel transport system substrate-binding protein/oligopeptide transport system substrate-binding protein [Chryseomicrobium aureum]
MRNKKIWSFLLFFGLIMMLFLAACSSDEQGSEGNNEEGNNEEGTNEESGEPKVLIFGRGGDSVSLDPIAVTDGESFKVTQNVFETLVNFGEQDTTINPGLAKEWTVSDDGLTYTFMLEEGVKFHDGTDFNAEAVVANFDRWSSGTADKYYYYKSMFGGFGDEEGHVIESVTADDEFTVTFKLKRPQAPFLKNIAMSPFGMGSPTAFEAAGDAFGDEPVGTGPFKFVEWKRNDSITIEKFEDYWQEGFPKLDRVVFRAIPDNSARLNALLTGEIDLADGVNPSDGASIEGDAALQLFERPSMNVGYLGLTNTRPPFDNVLVRQAMNHAIDKQAIVDAFFEGRAEVAVNPMPPSISGYNDQIEGYDYDPERAKELLAEAGLPDGFEMELWAMPVPRPYMPDGMKVAEVMQKNLADVGITAEIVSFEWATYLEKARNGEADAFMLGWTGDNGDADNFLYVLLDGDNIGSNNYTYYDNEELHELLIAAQSEVDENTRNELYMQAQEIIHEDAPWVPLAHSTPLLAGKAELTGFTPHPTGSDKLHTVDFE